MIDCPTCRDTLLVGNIGRHITAAGVAEALEPAGPVRLVLHSSGGDHAHGAALYHLVRARPETSVHVVRAASAAVLVAVAADWRTIAPDGRMLVHRCAAVAAGTAADLHRQAEALAELDAAMLEILAERTGMPGAELEARLDAAGGELWLNAEQALEFGLVHAIVPGRPGDGSPSEPDPARVPLVRAEGALRSKLERLTDAGARDTHMAGRRAAAVSDATYATGMAAHDADVAEAIECVGLEALSARADEAARRVTETTRHAHQHVRRQLRALTLGGIPARQPALPSWTCPACGLANFHQPGDAYQLASCFNCQRK